ncbi:hypothetical protein [Xanthomonas arboricola]|uniref:Uncharacterized protein n=3 Tax=Xanthomonas arboricola TaxID=56448 RepID=A0AAP4K9Y7_9XANT|nr:hypothetical protein [Xanthomonas arboricola]MDN0202240.1 hypothetical protein [Xanthomonas arboricola pv. corylina]MDN0206726.1 hypothetical protein [Xanthomonas arboricola pv. corylina]MDN0210881.1 hypothetical protein [Xanthomonas arboricola pv. corylina]MDN0214242.1 hypothetical protein [Xanthomonas arboricola pv. corylina]MDN0218843.1 hypothetical protein [Xanthomonas arboricola pv. juglandis]
MIETSLPAEHPDAAEWNTPQRMPAAPVRRLRAHGVIGSCIHKASTARARLMASQ